MKLFLNKALALLIVCLLSTQLLVAQTTKKDYKIQVALMLDTSGSMDGLIDQAKTQLWKIVNDLALAECEGQKPELQIALYEYGNI